MFKVGDIIVTTYDNDNKFVNKIIDIRYTHTNKIIYEVVQLRSITRHDLNAQNGACFNVWVTDNQLLTDELTLELL